jgi:protein-tyrosine phosphatase
MTDRCTRILMVCTGNICRSPTAEGVVRGIAAARDMAAAIEVDSAGTQGYHVGDPPDERSQLAARKRGYEISGLRARRVSPDDFQRFDLILAMDREHLAILEQSRPRNARCRVGLFLDYARNFDVSEVPDPYYGGPAGFEHVLDLIEDAAAGLIASLNAGQSG